VLWLCTSKLHDQHGVDSLQALMLAPNLACSRDLWRMAVVYSMLWTGAKGTCGRASEEVAIKHGRKEQAAYLRDLNSLCPVSRENAEEILG